MGNSGFSRLPRNSPGIIRCEEKSRIESEKKATPQSTFEAELPGLVDDPFSGFCPDSGKGKRALKYLAILGVCLEQESLPRNRSLYTNRRSDIWTRKRDGLLMVCRSSRGEAMEKKQV
jgi:hypothetical protein